MMLNSPLSGGFLSEQELDNLRIEKAVSRAIRAMQAAAPRQTAMRGGSTPTLSYGFTYDRETGASVDYFKAGDIVGVKPVRG